MSSLQGLSLWVILSSCDQLRGVLPAGSLPHFLACLQGSPAGSRVQGPPSRLWDLVEGGGPLPGHTLCPSFLGLPPPLRSVPASGRGRMKVAHCRAVRRQAQAHSPLSCPPGGSISTPCLKIHPIPPHSSFLPHLDHWASSAASRWAWSVDGCIGLRCCDSVGTACLSALPSRLLLRPTHQAAPPKSTCQAL